jgi:CheY-like chemotaxis protein
MSATVLTLGFLACRIKVLRLSRERLLTASIAVPRFSGKARKHAMGHELPLIALAEDDDGTAVLIQRNLTRANVVGSIHRLTDGQDALDFVRCEGIYSGRDRKQRILLLLDIKMPRVDGLEALRQLKSDHRTALVPVVMLSSSGNPSEIRTCYELRCNAYVTKPVEYAEFAETISRLGELLGIIRFPECG